ncbi:hypothetical protein PE067_10495 [Paracoccus sp. DMF-8]|uniref:hypothetical protein n=1 Tax=Paracoccus sp. DMF-8 TaxID=3019445 RepID=UPI0023E819C9|nr:hypothetical protein [Paracoccus sp. DMF-8]MDF3606529.1 hypothetical protein [Paracoccus sp. DMF-8]
MSNADFSPTYQDTMVERMDRLLHVLETHGLSRTFVSVVVRNDTAWTRDYRTRNFTVATYDKVAAKLSGMWPDDIAWPSDIPRPAPLSVYAGDLEAVAERLAKHRNRSEARHG